MNSSKLFAARNKLYPKIVQQVIHSISRFMGQPVTPELVQSLLKATKPVVDQGRSLARDIAYRDYVEFIQKSQPVPKLQLNRFTDELWQASLEKATQDAQTLTDTAVQEIGMKADYWARDAEWGQRVHSAKQDTRIGKVARVDFNPPSCPFCTLLNSRGPVYLSNDTAARTLHAGDECSLVFVGKGAKDYPGKASTDAAKARYEDAVKATPHGGTNAILKALNGQHPDRQSGRVQKNTRQAVEEARKQELHQAKTRLATLEKIQPKTDSAKAYKAKQIERNKQIIQTLEGPNNAG